MVLTLASFVSLFGILLFILSFCFSDLLLIMIAVLILYVGVIIYNIKSKLLLSSLFMSSFGVFMFGRIISRLDQGVYLTEHFSDDICKHTFMCLFIALFAFHVGVIFNNSIKTVRLRFLRMPKLLNNDKFNCEVIRKISFSMFWFTLPFRIISLYYFYRTFILYGYRALYISGNIVPKNIDALARVHVSAMIAFLVLFPNKKNAYVVSAVEIIISILYLLAGKRIEFIQVLLLVFLVLVLRDNFNIDIKKFFNKKKIVTTIILLIVLIIILNYTAHYRFETNLESTGIFAAVAELLDSLGYSLEIIPLGLKNQYNFPGNNAFYFWGPLINWFKSITGLGTVYSGQTIENAMYGYSFGDTLTYIEAPYNYLVNGGGLGSNYIAELFHSYGYAGIVIFNVLLGFLINRLSVKLTDTSIIRYLKVYIFLGIIVMPRFNCWCWIADVISKTNILFWLIIVLALILMKRYEKQATTCLRRGK